MLYQSDNVYLYFYFTFKREIKSEEALKVVIDNKPQ
jgi:hypothetical protein